MKLDYDQILIKYTKFRGINIALNSKISEGLSREDCNSALNAVGILRRGGNIVFQSESDMQIVMDYAVHAVLRDGKSEAERCAQAPPFEVTDDEMFLLTAMAASRFMVYEIVSLVEGIGYIASDILSQTKDIFVADTLFSQSGRTGILFASRLFPVGEFFMSTGAGLPVLPEVKEPLMKLLSEGYKGVQEEWTKKDDSEISAKTIRLLLEYDVGSRVGYGNIGETPEDVINQLGILPDDEFHSPQEQYRRSDPKVGRNSPCPCGSGKKYKKCCG